jgi:hypothetical protein
MMRAHQPGSQPLDIPEAIPNPAAPQSVPVQVFGRREGGLSPRCCSRRPKSAKARNRVMWGVAVPRAMGNLPLAQARG